MQDDTDRTERLIRNERRGIWLALLVVLTLAATLLLGSGTRRAMLLTLTISIVFAVTWLSRQRLRGSPDELQKSRCSVAYDELRRRALARASQTAFFVLLGSLATFCLVCAVVVINLPSQMLAALAIVVGIVTFLAAFLLYDRD